MAEHKCELCGKMASGMRINKTQDGLYICWDCKMKAGGLFYNPAQKLLNQIKVDIAVREKK
ncbi:MAG: hypothetical protein KBS66_01870 [Eubacterium sp.]|nr:hypothetical protein [Candidatus Colimonas fimequi]